MALFARKSKRRYGSPHRDLAAHPRTIYWLTAAVLLSLSPHLFRMPWAVVSVSLIGIGWRLASSLRGWPLPPGPLRWLLALAGAAAVYVQYGALYGKVAGSSLLACMMTLKLLETRSVRDVEFTLFLAYFVLITNYFFAQDIPMALLTLAAVMLITATLISAHDNETPGMDVTKLRKVGVLMLQGLPLMLVLFILFPRAAGPLWSWPRDDALGLSGLSDSMSPGSVSDMILSDEIAFRVEFDGDRPPRDSDLYWRVLVFGKFDGKTWTRLGHTQPAEAHWVDLTEEPIEYTITMEPHSERWMFALEMPDLRSLPDRSRVTSEFRLLNEKKINQRLRYRLRSYRRYLFQSQPDDLPRYVRELNLRLPPGFGPKTRELAEQWRAQSQSDKEVVERAMRHFREQPFSYTLLAAPLGADPVDEFLFETREGYCEHFSSAFTFAMRAAGIPARVVAGYQGGEFNPVGKYMIVPQANAHAWSEVWLEGEGWMRMDPTSAVAPDRVNQGVNSALGSQIDLPSIARRGDDGLARQLSFLWDAVNNGWNQFVLGYGIRHQYELMEWLGIKDARRSDLVKILVVAMILALGIIAAWMFLRRPKPPHPALAAYLRFRRRLARHGLNMEASEAPLAFRDRAMREMPEQSAWIERVTDLFVRAYYRGDADQETLKALKEAVRAKA